MNKTEYFLKQSEIYFNYKFYPDAVSRRYYALLHLMVDYLEVNGNIEYGRKHKEVRIEFVKKYYGDKGNHHGSLKYKKIAEGFSWQKKLSFLLCCPGVRRQGL